MQSIRGVFYAHARPHIAIAFPSEIRYNNSIFKTAGR